MTIRNYEAMFILDSDAATADFEGTAGKVDEILQKHGATLVRQEKWDERKLAYEIRGRRRGVYYLVYFTSPSSAVAPINEDIQLSEMVLRHLVIALDGDIETHIARQDADRERMAEESRKSALGGWGDNGGGRRGSPRSSERRSGDSKDDESPRKSAPAARSETGAPGAPSPEAPSPAAASSPKAESPKAESPKAESPKAESPKAESPKAESPKAESPKAEAESLKAEDPKAEDPVAPAGAKDSGASS